MLELRNITKDYPVGDGVVRALKGIDLKFRDTEFVSVLGQSGCGKTTLLNIIGGLDRYTSGDLLIDGVSTKVYKDVDWDAYRNLRIGFVFQSYNLISHMTILDNVAMALTLSGVSRSERNRRAREALAKVGLSEQVKKLPNQLSGGQMQRVSIARALINDPEIILADEPTGALDSATSIQVMDILKEISETRLIIMVTHNSELADKYSTRIVRLKDGEVIDDSDPFTPDENTEAQAKELAATGIGTQLTEKEKKKKLKRTSMSFLTAIKLSFRNLMTKKGRTIMTAIAGSIGIIGVSLVLAISNGFTSYVTNLQTTVLSGYPVQITSQTLDTEAIMALFMGTTSDSGRVQYPQDGQINGFDSSDAIDGLFTSNDISQEYIEYVQKAQDYGWASSIDYGYGMEYTVVNKTQSTAQGTPSYEKVNNLGGMMGLAQGGGPSIGWYQLLENKDLILSQYDVIAGKFPENKNEVVLVVDTYNTVNTTVLEGLGIPFKEYSDVHGNIKMPLETVLGKELTILDNNALYKKLDEPSGNRLFEKREDDEEFYRQCVEGEYTEGVTKVQVVGVLRLKEDEMLGLLTQGINYLPELRDEIMASNAESEIVLAQKENTEYNIVTGDKFSSSTSIIDSDAQTYKQCMQQLGGDNTPTDMNIYPVDFEAKEQIINHLDAWNSAHPDNEVKYTDLSATATEMMNEIIRIISIVLVCFAAISLVVSSVMIGIITYVSVVERTKEIGILRSLGARKRDIYNVFNAESFIVGLFAGVIGVVVTYILQPIVNVVIQNIANMPTLSLCSFNPLHALLMVVISFCLTVIAGLVPSSVAAKRDPVVALRSE